MSSLSREQEDALSVLAKENDLLPEGPSLSNSKRPEVKLPADNRELHDFARDLGQYAAKTLQLFRRDRTPVLVNEAKKRLDEMSAPTFMTWISDHVACYRIKMVKVGEGEDTESVPVRKFRTMTPETAKGVLASLHFWSQLPEIKRLNLVRLPVIRNDGQCALLPRGYSAEQCIFTLDDLLTYDESMKFEQARLVIDDIWSEFPLPDSRSKAVAVANQLTMFCRSMLPKGALVPAGVYHGNSVGAGKTLAAKIAIIPICGSAAPRPLPRNEEEAKKILDTIAMAAHSYVLFDNIRGKGKIQSPPIETFITSAECTGRILGQSQDFTVENVTTVFMTGNQFDPGKDIKERALFVELFVQQADNRDRHIKRVISDSFLAAKAIREKICSALWAFVRKWDADGRPAPLSIFQRFEDWSAIVPAIVANSGYGDPVEIPVLPGANDEVDDMRSLVEAHAPALDEESSSHDFAELMVTVKHAGLFEEIGGYRDKELYDGESLTRSGQSVFGKLFTRFDRRLFAIEDRTFRFVAVGRGESRRYVIEVAAA